MNSADIIHSNKLNTDNSVLNFTYAKEIEDSFPLDKEEVTELPSQPVLESDTDPDINGGYAWVILASLFTISCCSWGANASFAVYFAYYSTNNLYSSATSVDFAAIGGITFGLGICLSPLINYINGKVTPKGGLMIGNILQFLSLFITSFDSHKQLWQVYLTQGVLQSFGLAFLVLPAFTILPLWFKNKGNKEKYSIRTSMLTLSQSIMAAGSGGGGLLFNLGMQKVIEAYGLRWALRTQSFITLFCITIAIFFLRDKTTRRVKIEFTMFDKDIFWFPAFWGLVLFLTFTMFGYVVIIYCLDDWTISLGYSEHQGSIIAGMVSLGIFIARPILGIAADKYGALLITTISSTITGIFVFAMWIPGRNFATAIAFGLIVGGFSGNVFVISSLILLAVDFRIHKLNVTFSMSFMAMGAAAVVSPIISLSLQKKEVSPTQYEYCAIFVGLSYMVVLIVLLLLRGFMISIKEIQTPGLSDKEYFALRPKLSRILRNSLKFRQVGWM